MKAFVSDRYGSPDVMELREVDKPELTEEGALVRVRATSVNAFDWHMLRGKPYLARLGEGFRSPKTTILGLDVAGIVEAVGANVTHIKPGDEVFGSRTGAFAEYVSGRTMVPMPEGLTFEQAAAVPTAGQTALVGAPRQGRDPGGPAGADQRRRRRRRNLRGADRQGPRRRGDRRDQHEERRDGRSIGADQVVDYTREDFTRGGAALRPDRRRRRQSLAVAHCDAC